MIETIAIDGVEFHEHQLTIYLRADRLRFTTTYWYTDVDFDELKRKYGEPFLEKLCFHMAAFEANKLTSLKPRVFDLGPYAHLHTERFERLWKTVVRRKWSQWRFENDLADYEGPVLSSRPVASQLGPLEVKPGPVDALAFCGGGKDSLVMMKLLEATGIAYSSLAYSHTMYGQAWLQHKLIDGLVEHCSPLQAHQQWIFDDFLDSPVLRFVGGDLKSLAKAETPSSMFAALPLLLQHSYRYMVLGNEASANSGNLIWEETGEDVNHQWGKSLEAERLLDTYLREEFIGNARFFSLLQPVHDPVIFSLLNRNLGALAETHSCNLIKPWCERCSKCAYVYLGYMAYLPEDQVRPLFSRNLFDVPELQADFGLMLGLGDHTPFECIGQVEDARLAFELCRRKGLSGAAIETFKNIDPPPDVERILAEYLSVNHGLGTIPKEIADRVLPELDKAAREARELFGHYYSLV